MPRVNRLEGQYNVKVFENEKTKGPKHDGKISCEHEGG